MKVKVGDKIYDGSDIPIMVILEPKDKENILNAPSEMTQYAQYPATEEWLDKIKVWMEEV